MIPLNNYTVKINPSKMKSARLARGLKKTELSDLIGLSVTSISNYENGTMDISKENLDKYSEILNFPIRYFEDCYRYNVNTLERSPIFFRSSSVTNEIRNMYEQKYEHLMLVYKTLSEYLEFPSLNTSLKNNLNKNGKIGYLNEDIELLTLELRGQWALGDGPIEKLLGAMIQNGIIVSKTKTNLKATTDAFSQILDNTPIVFLNKYRGTAVRDRFSLAHELGHIILHSNITEADLKNKDIYNQVEEEANRFASSLLLPASSFSEDIITVDINSLIPLKEKWKVSLKGIIMRLAELDIITQQQKTNRFIYISKKKWNISEPLDDTIEKEEVNLFQEAFDVLFEEGVVEAKSIIDEIGIGRKRIEEVCGLSSGFFDPYIGLTDKKPKLRLIK